MKLDAYLEVGRRDVDTALRAVLPKASVSPSTLHRAMRYSVFAGGKRMRPILCLAAAEACGGERADAMPLACAVECIHTYSLIHDDLPCMDDDDFRRGKPSNHKAFGEAVAVLAGDALLTLAFEIASSSKASKRYTTAEMVSELAFAAGSRRLIAGQVLDMEGEGGGLNRAALRKIHENKTAALIVASARLGGMSAGATMRRLEALGDFAYALGLAFQVIDDILDVTQTSEVLGKSAGKDAAVEKATYPAIYGLEGARKEAARLTKRADAVLRPFGKRGARLAEIAHYLLDREY
ncbi:MAG: polyprenyl synthetase family protein [Verrucomicrobiota bacterium]